MLKFILRRCVIGVATVLLVAVGAFFFLRAVPGDPVDIWLGDYATPELKAQVTAKWGLDKPLWEQFEIYMRELFHGDLGTSLRSGMPISKMVSDVYPYTVRLMIGSILIGVALGIAFGVFAAVRQNSALDLSVMSMSFVFISMPSFVLAYVLLWWLGVKARVFPIIGAETPGLYATYLPHLVLPWLVNGLRTTGMVSRMVRCEMLDVLAADYIRTARSKGLSERLVQYRHALRNSMTGVLGLVGVEIIIMLGGVVIAEVVFSRPGLGRLYFTAISARDYPLTQGCILVISAMVVLINLIVDVLYGILDPRVRYD
ncbi:MAG: ABC transporter permease [Thermotogota bacterium]